MKLYPTIEEVFDAPMDFYKTVFFPLLTLDLNTMNKGEGKVHFITVWGNGNPELDYKDNLFNYNSIRFDWTGDKYIFNGDLSSIETFNNLKEWYLEAEQEYLENKSDYLTYKTFDEVKKSHLAQQNKRREAISFEYYHYVKGVINYWITRNKYLETGLFIQGNAYTGDYCNEERKIYNNLSKTGITTRSNELIGKVTGYNYSEIGEDEISLYIDRKQNQVFQKFNWS
ncbi:hypothetical protein [Myroides odoratimimus]|uniref:hypothetical protein n=1 Tax=Myroides odoratimimus TaxID=76832 RepID=UPI00046838F7|nr:hypothetical protein [Myroides odoratimimus]